MFNVAEQLISLWTMGAMWTDQVERGGTHKVDIVDMEVRKAQSKSTFLHQLPYPQPT